MLVILRENVENLGQVGDLVKVSDGYARNYLLPRKLVAAADDSNKLAIENQQKALAKKRAAQLAGAQDLAKKLGEFTVNISRKGGENDKLFGSVSNGDIAEVLKKAGFSLDKRQIQIETPIKSLGAHSVSVKLSSEVTATVKVQVLKEA